LELSTKRAGYPFDGVGEETFHHDQEVASEPFWIANSRIHLGLESVHQRFEVERRMGMDLDDRLDVVLVRAHRFHEYEIVSLGNGDLEVVKSRQDAFEA